MSNAQYFGPHHNRNKEKNTQRVVSTRSYTDKGGRRVTETVEVTKQVPRKRPSPDRIHDEDSQDESFSNSDIADHTQSESWDQKLNDPSSRNAELCDEDSSQEQR